MNKRVLFSEGAKDSLIHLISSWGDNALPERFFALNKDHNVEDQGVEDPSAEKNTVASDKTKRKETQPASEVPPH